MSNIIINTWLRVFFAIQHAATEGRGSIELLDAEGEVTLRFPETTGDDVIAIGAVIDPIVRSIPLRFGGGGISRRWRAVADELASYALVDGDDTYRRNQSFWAALLPLAVYLHSIDAPLPDPNVIGALVDALAEGSYRNGAAPPSGGPFKQFDAKTFDDLYTEQYKYLVELRGYDLKDPLPGTVGEARRIPRTTNGDVVLLADYWSGQLDRVKKVMGHDGVAKRWNEALVDIDTNARKGDPNVEYPNNNAFWRTLKPTAVHIAAGNEAPTKWDLVFDAIKDNVKNLPENIADVAGGLAHGVGKVANEAGRGLFSGLGGPLLLGTAGIVGLYLLVRDKGEKTKEA